MTKSTVHIERAGINAAEKFFNDAGWFFREQPVMDWGIDAHVEVGEDGKPTGRLIGLQIKSGSSFFKKKGDDYIFYGRSRHLEYWSNHSLPCFLILYNPDDSMLLWCRLERRLVEVTDKGWSIIIPRGQILTKDSLKYIAQGISNDPESKRRARLTVDYALIKAVAEEDEVYLTIPLWINKSLNFRGAAFTFGDLNKKEADIDVPYWAPFADIPQIMDDLMPWLDYEYAESVEEHAGEVEDHKLLVNVNELGQAFLRVEDFARNGLGDRSHPDPAYGDEEDVDEAEWMEMMWRRASERDD